MLALIPEATRLGPDVRDVAERFLSALGPGVRRELAEVRLYGAQARRHSPGEPFLFMVVVAERTLALRAGVGLAVDDTRRWVDPETEVEVATVSLAEWTAAPASASAVVRNARREGVCLWRRAT